MVTSTTQNTQGFYISIIRKNNIVIVWVNVDKLVQLPMLKLSLCQLLINVL
jgi:hypothetical protein